MGGPRRAEPGGGVAIIADIEDLAATEFLLMLSLNRKSGRLSGVRGNERVMVALDQGAIVYAASTAVRERVGNILVSRRLITEEQLQEALAEQQRQPAGVYLGNILVRMGAVSQEQLTGVVQSQFQRVLRELLSWSSGVLTFNRMDLPDLGAVHVDPREILVEMGFETEQLVLGSLSALEDARRDLSARGGAPAAPPIRPAPPPSRPDAGGRHEGGETLRSLMEEMQALSFSLDAEMTLAILSRAAEVVERAVLLLVFPDFLSGAGGFGVACGGESAEVVVRKLTIPRSADSVFQRVIDQRRPFRGPLPSSVANQHLLERLGGVEPPEAVAVPMVSSGRVVAILYGDNGAAGPPIPSTAALEAQMAATGRSIEAGR